MEDRERVLIMRDLWKIILLFLLLFFSSVEVTSGEISLQQRINQLPEGATLHLPKGIYHEAISLSRSITLEGEDGTVIENCTSRPAVNISGKNVTLRKISIENCDESSNAPALYITGSGHTVERIAITQASGIGIKLDQAMKCNIKNVHISGKSKENGVDLWNSAENNFQANTIETVQDGFYMENSHQNIFVGNVIRNSRYGIHVMFSDDILIQRNRSEKNFTGAMVMGTTGTRVIDNRLSDNNVNVNAQGLLLYDVHDSIIRGNEMSSNRVGMYVDESSENLITKNSIIGNTIGAQLNNAAHNKIQSNQFRSNIADVQGNRSASNTVIHNYWDSAMVLDTDGDGYSNLPYRADPYFLKLMKQAPEYQLFFQHPGMLLLQKMLKSPEALLVTDTSPLMRGNFYAGKKINTWNRAAEGAAGLGMVLVSLLFIYKGRKRV